MRRLFAAFLFLLPLAAMAGGQQKTFDEGIEYQLISPRPTLPLNVSKGKVQVAEFFWYQCPHCAHLEPTLEHWRRHDMPADVEFVRVPAVLAPNWYFMARVYYTAQLLGVEARMTPILFKAIQADGRKMEDLKGVEALFARQGVPEKRFKEAFESLAVSTRVRRAIQLTHEYGITGVPTLVVNGRYRVDPNRVGSYPRMLRVVDYLVHHVHDENVHAGHAQQHTDLSRAE
ncbi:hypothetical protein BJI67_02115 [Acidihalobacter aeolianus]|uniref:Thiol:disulfide interchange protein n=1 Tax=Acidihalobacter aeolianus TaxID=2792603 RepID=A0A1D8K4Z0_9GAMM|nr:thiol:disulfide interchange protein DsbA/DsbL [Acidihalobacter aeolianus]AOV16025.1 hypothetical protein BJI67_02115 [Acidihalobacter aeolianus]